MDTFPPTTEQQRVIKHRGSNVLVFAGPGTGKTETLARRFASLVADDGVRADRILVLTFSRRAAAEMADRIVKRLRERLGKPLAVPELYVSTFHAFCRRLLEADGRRFGGQTLLTPVRERLLWRRVIDEPALKLASIETSARESVNFATDCLNVIGQLKSRGVSARRLGEIGRGDRRLSDIAAIFAAMEAEQTKRGVGDVRDLVNEAVAALAAADSPQLDWLRAAAFEHVLVDEFQDSDPTQLELLRRVAMASEKRIEFCFVGDTNQAIYRFRGAAPENVERARDEFECAELTLRRNRRSAPAVIEAANATPLMDEGALTTAADPGLEGSVTLHVAADENAEIAHVCDAIAARVAGGADPSSIAVLLRRTQPYQQSIAHGLAERGVPVATGAATAFADDPVVNVVLTALRLLADPDDRESAFRLLTDPIVGFDALGVRLAFCGRRYDSAVGALAAAPPRGRREWAWFERAWRALMDASKKADLPAIVRAIAYELDVLAPARGEQTAGYEQLGSPARLSALIGAAEDYLATMPGEARGRRGIELFLSRIQETIGLLAEESALVPPATPGVRVMSVHAAKGLEFDTVFVPELIDGVFPARERANRLLSQRSAARLAQSGVGVFATGADAEQEERSLYYVALTRAKRDVMLSASRYDGDNIETVLSRFVQRMTPAACGPRLACGGTDEVGPLQSLQIQDPIRVDPGVLSPTSIGQFLKCPRQFFYERVLRLRDDRDDDSAQFGRATHEALRRFHEAQRDFRNAALADVDALRAALRAHGAAALDAEWRAAGIPPTSAMAKHDSDCMIVRLDRYLTWLIDEARARPFEVVACERAVEGVLAGVNLRGKVDRIDRLADGSLCIRDYKTGKRRDTLIKYFANVCGGETVPFGDLPRTLNLQLLLYAPLVEADFGATVSRVSYLYLNGADRDLTLAADEAHITDAAEGEGALTRAAINAGLERVLRGIVAICSTDDRTWFPTANDDRVCESCAYVKTCPGAGAFPL